MLRTTVLIAALALTAAGKEPRSVDRSQRSVAEITNCIVNRLSETRGYEVQRTGNAERTEVRMKFRVAGVAATAATFVTSDEGNFRQLTIFATGKATGAPRTIAAGVRSCAAPSPAA